MNLFAVILLAFLFCLVASQDSAGHWVMVVGGYDSADDLDEVELVSLDPISHPVPDCLQRLGNFPRPAVTAGGAVLKDGNEELLNMSLS